MILMTPLLRHVVCIVDSFQNLCHGVRLLFYFFFSLKVGSFGHVWWFKVRILSVLVPHCLNALSLLLFDLVLNHLMATLVPILKVVRLLLPVIVSSFSRRFTGLTGLVLRGRLTFFFLRTHLLVFLAGGGFKVLFVLLTLVCNQLVLRLWYLRLRL